MSGSNGDSKAGAGGIVPHTQQIAVLLEQGNIEAALALSEPVLSGNNARAIYELAKTFASAGDMQAACSMLQRCVELEPDKLEYLLTLANCLAQSRQHRKAIEPFRLAASLSPGNPNILHALAHSLIVAGATDDAEPLLWKAVNIDPQLAAGHYLLSGLRRYEERNDEHIVLLERMLADFTGNARDFSRMAFALGRALDRCGEYPVAYSWIEKANAARKSESVFDLAQDQELVERTIAAYPGELLATAETVGCEADWPVLIVGMPRSGSTLVEQIIASHPLAQGVGEVMYLSHILKSEAPRFLPAGQQLPEAAATLPGQGWRHLGQRYAAALRHHDPLAKRIVDKQLFNYFDLGAARLMMPVGKVIHCVRDPFDTCLSCFFTSFRQDRGFTYDLNDLGQSYVLYRRLMQHWNSVNPYAHTVSYERLVSDQRGETQALLDFLGLPWDDACLSFEDNTREVSTSSQVQVRQRIHSGSVGRWQNYREQLEPLRKILETGRQKYRYS